MEPGTLVRITIPGPLGTLRDVRDYKFAEETLGSDDTAEYFGPHLELDDWEILKCEFPAGTRYCPVHRGSFEPVN